MTARATRVVAIRHGETAWNVEVRVQGHLDIDLNERGRWQVQRLAQALAGEPLAAVYSSDLRRARDTAAALAAPTGLDVQCHSGLRERSFGCFEGLTLAEIEQRFPEGAQRWRRRDAGFDPGGGETLAAFYARAIGTVTELAARHRGQHIAIVSHGGVLDALYRAAMQVALDVPRSWALGNASINRLLHGDDGFRLIGWGDALHLEQPALEQGAA